MPNLSQKLPFARALNDFAQQKALDAMAQMGRALPASVTAVQGSIVTVSFAAQSLPGNKTVTLPNVTCPIACSQWIRPPIQVGDQGIVIPSDVSVSGIDGIGSGTATLSLVGNLSAVAFVPTATKSWVMDDPQSVLVNGPNGVIIRDAGKNCVFTLTTSGVTITIGGQVVFQLTSSGIVVPHGNVTATGIDLMTHTHGGVQSGGSNTGPPVG